MYDFSQNRHPRDYLSRREQLRLLLLVMSLGLAIILMMEARKPKNWQWLFAAAEHKERTPEEKAPAGGSFPGVKRAYLESVRDDSPFRSEEHDAWFHLLDILRKTDEAVLERASTGRVAFIQLFNQPEEYRGELVDVRGTIRRAHYVRAGKNKYAIKGYYQTWVQPADRPDSPIVVYCMFLPEGFPTGMELAEKAEITGFFYKRWAYRARDTLRTAPTILARTVRWRKPPLVAHERSTGIMWPLIALGVAAALGILAAVYLFVRAGHAISSRDTVADADQDENIRRSLEELEP